jgi:hypothetical protein
MSVREDALPELLGCARADTAAVSRFVSAPIAKPAAMSISSYPKTSYSRVRGAVVDHARATGMCLRLPGTKKSMGRLSRILSIAAMAIHLTVSCCHCSHECEDKSCSAPCQGMTAPAEGSRGCLCDHSDSEFPCCRAKSPTLHPRAKTGGHLGPRSTPSAGTPPDCEPSRVASNSQEPSLACGRLLLSVRLHLANLVLLI